MKKAQSAMEFVILFGFILFMFTTFFVAIKASTYDKIKENQELAIKQVAITVQDEINLALQSSDGYSRKFKIPAKISGLEYEIELVEGYVYINTKDEHHAIALPIPDVKGDINIGLDFQVIRKNEGVIYLNE